MKTLIIAPHADDELLGCGGYALRKLGEGGKIGWALFTNINSHFSSSDLEVKAKQQAISIVLDGLGIKPDNFFDLGYTPSSLNDVSRATLVRDIHNVLEAFQPEEVLLPFPGDAHSDHQQCFEASISATKWFRNPSIHKVLVYETLSETNFAKDPTKRPFCPNYFVNITEYLDKKIKLLRNYESELDVHPFPRSIDAVKALSVLRGSQAGYKAAEAFMTICHRI